MKRNEEGPPPYEMITSGIECRKNFFSYKFLDYDFYRD